MNNNIILCSKKIKSDNPYHLKMMAKKYFLVIFKGNFHPPGKNFGGGEFIQIILELMYCKWVERPMKIEFKRMLKDE